MERSRAYSSLSWGQEGRWSCLVWKSPRGGSGCFSRRFFCPEAEFWRSVCVGRLPTPGQGKGPGFPLSFGSKHILQSLAPERPASLLRVRYSSRGHSQIGVQPFVSCVLWMEGARSGYYFLPLCRPRPDLGCFCERESWGILKNPRSFRE